MMKIVYMVFVWKGLKNKKTDINQINRRLALVEVFINKNIQNGNKIFKTLKSPLQPKNKLGNLDNFLNYILTTQDYYI